MLAAIVVAACQAQEPSPSGPSGGTAEPAASVLAPSESPAVSSEPAHRLDVTIARDPKRSATSAIGRKGGSLDLDLGGGTTATLVVPPFALLESTKITMTAASVRDWPDAPPKQAAVQLEPDGLELFVRATLTFEQPAVGPDGTHGAIAWSGQGRALHAALGTRDGGAISLDVEHFSGYGLTWNIGTEAYWTSWGRTTAEGAAADIENDLAALLGWFRTEELLGIEHKPVGEVIGHFVDAWYDAVYEPSMRAGETTCEGGRMALSLLNTMIRLLEKAGVPAVRAYQDFLLRRQPGQSTQFPFDTIPDDYLAGLVQRCDEEALEHCRATGDIELLRIYIRDRTQLLELAGRTPATTGEGLMDACARFRLEAEFTFGEDTSWGEGVFRPSMQVRKQWNVRVTVDLRWLPMEEGAPPWISTLQGQAMPTVRPLEWRERSRHVIGTDQGPVDKGWYPWCAFDVQFGAWHPWVIQITSLDFQRDRITHRYQLPLMRIPLSPTYGVVLGERTIEVEGPLRTIAFRSGSVLFHELQGAKESYTSPCNPGAGSDLSAFGVFDTWRMAQPEETSWELTNEGISAKEIRLTDAQEHPFRARREWTSVREKKYADVHASVRWDATITLTHTPR